MSGRPIINNELGRFQYLDDPNWTSYPYILDYDTHKRYYPHMGLDTFIILMCILDIECKRVKKENKRLKQGVKKLNERISENDDIIHELEDYINYLGGWED